MAQVTEVLGSFRQTFTTGDTTTIAAGTGTAGHLLAVRWTRRDIFMRLRSLEIEFFLSTAFGAAQEVGFDVLVARNITASAAGATAATIAGSGRMRAASLPSAISAGDIRVADAGAITSGTHTLDANAIARGSQYLSAIGQSISPRYYDFTQAALGGLIFAANEGFVIRNTILMGATGVGKWHITADWDEISIA